MTVSDDNFCFDFSIQGMGIKLILLILVWVCFEENVVCFVIIAIFKVWQQSGKN
jgi:hypothetical protein